jgi:hypothetical protein
VRWISKFDQPYLSARSDLKTNLEGENHDYRRKEQFRLLDLLPTRRCSGAIIARSSLPAPRARRRRFLLSLVGPFSRALSDQSVVAS